MSQHSPAIPPSVSSVSGAHGTTTQLEEIGNPHYAMLGGREAVQRLVDAFYAQMDDLPEARHIRAMHPEDLGEVKKTLVLYLSEWLGGPAQYSQERGHPRLRRRHLRFAIGPEERDAWMRCMRGALDQVCGDADLKSTLIRAFLDTADFIRNDAGTTHKKHGTHA